jgi:hypothetical protein
MKPPIATPLTPDVIAEIAKHSLDPRSERTRCIYCGYDYPCPVKQCQHVIDLLMAELADARRGGD